TVSLWRSYRTTVRLYTGQFTSGKTRAAPTPAPAAPVAAGPRKVGMLEQHVPWVSEQAAAIALGGFRSLLRAPEAKMMLLTPIILVVVFGSMFLGRRGDPPEMVRPLMGFGAMATVLLGMVQLLGNQFGFDRSGFRVFVLCPARRRDILLGKNLAFAPMAAGLAGLLVLLLQIFM